MTKESRVLEAFMSGVSFNRFEAEKVLHDHCLNSTVATLQRKYGITINRIYETVRGYLGSPTRVCRYWIDTEERERIIFNRIWKQKRKEAANPTDQDKESGLQPNMFNPTNAKANSQTPPKKQV